MLKLKVRWRWVPWGEEAEVDEVEEAAGMIKLPVCMCVCVDVET